MREIKVKAWDKEEKRFWTFDDAGEESGNGTVQFYGENGRLVFGRLVDIDVGVGLATDFTEFPLFKFTNSLDRKGNEIFLGDIARRDFEIFETHWGGSEEGGDLGPTGEVVIEEGYFIGVVSQTPQGLYVLNKCSKYDVEGNFVKKCSHIKLHAKYAEVIGNEIENPELLEVTK